MNHYPQKPHKSSDDELIDALEKLEQTLESRDRLSPPKSPPKPAPKLTQPLHKSKQEVLLSALEEAAADIEQFMAAKHSHSDESQ